MAARSRRTKAFGFAVCGALIVAAGAVAWRVADAQASTRPNERAAHELMSRHGCPACHSIPRMRAANSTVGPPLDALGRRVYVGGRLNTAENLAQFLREPSAERPSTMPNVGLSEREAREIAAYLSTLR